MLTTLRSSRPTIGRIPTAAAVSIILFDGKQNTIVTPSRRNTSATAWLPFMHRSLHPVLARRETRPLAPAKSASILEYNYPPPPAPVEADRRLPRPHRSPPQDDSVQGDEVGPMRVDDHPERIDLDLGDRAGRAHVDA